MKNISWNMKKDGLLVVIGTMVFLTIMGLIILDVTVMENWNEMIANPIFEGTKIILFKFVLVVLFPLIYVLGYFVPPALVESVWALPVFNVLSLVYLGLISKLFWLLGKKLLKIK